MQKQIIKPLANIYLWLLILQINVRMIFSKLDNFCFIARFTEFQKQPLYCWGKIYWKQTIHNFILF